MRNSVEHANVEGTGFSVILDGAAEGETLATVFSQSSVFVAVTEISPSPAATDSLSPIATENFTGFAATAENPVCFAAVTEPTLWGVSESLPPVATEICNGFSAATVNSVCFAVVTEPVLRRTSSVLCGDGDEDVGTCSPCTPGGGAVPMLSPCTPGGGVGSKFLGSSSSPSLASPTAEEVQRRIIEFGGIMDASAADLRTRDRIRSQQNADVTIMDRAMDLAHRWDPNEGNNFNDAFSITAISYSEIIASAEKMGIS